MTFIFSWSWLSKLGTNHDKPPRSNKQNGKNHRTKNYNRPQEVLNNGKSKKETHACPKTRKEEGKGRKAEEVHVAIHEW